MAELEAWSDVCTQAATCALTGAAAFFAGVPDAEMVANGPLWCYFYALRHIERNDPTIARRFHGTQPDNQSVVYGTEDCLLEALARYRREAPPSVLLIENSCAVGLIGDDIAGIAAKAALPCPVVCLDSGGLKGGFSEGYRLAARALLDAAPPQAGPAAGASGAVNLLGCTDAYYNGRQDGRELRRLLRASGYTVAACPGAGSSVADLRRLTDASLNIVVHAELGLELAQLLQERYHMPYIAPLPPYGLAGTRQWLADIAAALPGGGPAARDEVDAVEQALFARVNEAKSIWGELWFEQALIAAPASTALGLARALRREWADVGELCVVLQDGPSPLALPEDIDRLWRVPQDGAAVETFLRRLRDGLALGSGNEAAVLRRAGAYDVQLCPVADPVYDEVRLTDAPFMGTRGAQHMAERLWNGRIQQLLRRSERVDARLAPGDA